MNGGDDGTRTRGLCRDRQCPEVTGCNFTAPIATLGALRNPREVLLHPNCTQLPILGPCCRAPILTPTASEQSDSERCSVPTKDDIMISHGKEETWPSLSYEISRKTLR